MNPGEPRFWPPPGPLLSPRFLEAGRWPKASGNLQLIWRPKVGLWRARVGGPVWEPRGPLPAQAQSQSQLSPLCLKGQKSLSIRAEGDGARPTQAEDPGALRAWLGAGLSLSPIVAPRRCGFGYWWPAQGGPASTFYPLEPLGYLWPQPWREGCLKN